MEDRVLKSSQTARVLSLGFGRLQVMGFTGFTIGAPPGLRARQKSAPLASPASFTGRSASPSRHLSPPIGSLSLSRSLSLRLTLSRSHLPLTRSVYTGEKKKNREEEVERRRIGKEEKNNKEEEE
jgi:hypothetical protein